ncbi:MAG: DUF1634 domain-containing protein [Candidatus Methanomethylophilaceae archaeon]|nr:DUF1634 domain-containing protein [Candidatus Methanomethylophilaceae archaeon]
MNPNRSTALTLRIGVVIGIALRAAGLAVSMSGHGETVLYVGILVLILSPLAGVIATFASLVSLKDWFWAAVAAALLCITAVGAAVAML